MQFWLIKVIFLFVFFKFIFRSVLEPVFRHFDLHNKWDPPAQFAIKTFKAILYSIQSQNSYFVIQVYFKNINFKEFNFNLKRNLLINLNKFNMENLMSVLEWLQFCQIL